MSDGSDFERYLAARWADLVGGLEDDGVPADEARLAVAATLLAARRGWERRERQEQVDVTLWAEARERAGLAARPGDVAPHGVRPLDPGDDPAPWLARAQVQRAARRRRTLLRGLVAAAVVAVLAAGWAWWARPDAHPVREEANPLPVVWYAQGELHLEDVVVAIEHVRAFEAYGDDVVVLLDSGRSVLVEADGDVVPTTDIDARALEDGSVENVYVPLGRDDVLLQTVELPGGGWAHLIDSSRRADDGEAVRLSESGRRALVICDRAFFCQQPITVVEGGGSIRLR